MIDLQHTYSSNMKVIVAGLPKTGTKSMCDALRLLGYVTYDWIEHFWFLSGDWDKMYNEGGTVDDFKRMYAGVDAVTDSPSCYFWEEIWQAFPEAKVILTVRDEDKWYGSVVRQFEALSKDLFLKLMNSLTPSGLRVFRHRKNDVRFRAKPIKFPWSGVSPYNPMIMKRFFRQHNLYVKQTVPKENLLVFNVSEGWAPLCQFLQVEQPEEPFPHKNKNGSVIDEYRAQHPIMKRMERELWISLSVIFVILALGLFGIVQYIR